MTQWRTPGEPPRPPGPEAPAQREWGAGPLVDRPGADGTRPAPRTQWIVLGVAGAFIVTAVVLLVVVLTGGNDPTPHGPQPGSADTVTDELAAALHAGSAGGVRAVSCAGAERRVLAAARPAFGAAAARQGVAKLQGDVGVGQISLSDAGSAQSGTIGLRRVGAQWCVASFVAGA
jgi:hypothetical protein